MEKAGATICLKIKNRRLEEHKKEYLEPKNSQ